MELMEGSALSLLFLSPVIIQTALTALRSYGKIQVSIGKIAIITTILNIGLIATISYYQQQPDPITHQPPDGLTGALLILYGALIGIVVIPIVGITGFLIWRYERKKMIQASIDKVA